jgi:hypothetical protein
MQEKLNDKCICNVRICVIIWLVALSNLSEYAAKMYYKKFCDVLLPVTRSKCNSAEHKVSSFNIHVLLYKPPISALWCTAVYCPRTEYSPSPQHGDFHYCLQTQRRHPLPLCRKCLYLAIQSKHVTWLSNSLAESLHGFTNLSESQKQRMLRRHILTSNWCVTTICWCSGYIQKGAVKRPLKPQPTCTPDPFKCPKA